jgi:hypothetical protein
VVLKRSVKFAEFLPLSTQIILRLTNVSSVSLVLGNLSKNSLDKESHKLVK